MSYSVTRGIIIWISFKKKNLFCKELPEQSILIINLEDLNFNKNEVDC